MKIQKVSISKVFLLPIYLLVLLATPSLGEGNADFFIGYKQYYSRGIYSDAIKYFNNVIQEEPKNEPAHRYLALSYERKKNFDEAISIWERCLSFSSNEANIKAHIKNIEKLKEIRGGSDNTENLYSYLFQISQDNYPESPISFYALTGIIHYHFTRKDYPMVITSYQEMKKLHPEEEIKTETLYEYASSLIETKKFITASKILEELLKRPDTNKEEIEGLAITCYLGSAKEYQNQNEKSSALEMYQKVIDLSSEPDQVNFAQKERDILLEESDNLFKKADLLMYTSEEDTKEAGKLYSKLLKEYPLHPKIDNILFHYIETILVEKNYQKARDLFLQFVKKYPDSHFTPEALFRAAQCNLERLLKKSGFHG